VAWVIKASRFGDKDEKGDFPELSVGDHFLYLSFDLTKSGRTACVRMALESLRQTNLKIEYFLAPFMYVRAAQNTGDVGYFAGHKSTSELRVFAWPEDSVAPSYFDVPIDTVATEDWPVKIPAKKGDWLDVPGSKISWRVRGATRSGPELWVAWSAARKILGQAQNRFAYPHIEIAVVDVVAQQIRNQRFIHDDKTAFAWPSLATNAYGDVGMSFCFTKEEGGPQYGVAVLTGPDQGLIAVTGERNTTGAGGHYVSVRAAHPSGTSFCGAGFYQLKTTLENHPHLVFFGVAQVPRIEVHTERNQMGGWVYVSGSGFTPNDTVDLYAEGLIGMSGRLALGFANTAADGTFNNFVYNAHCRGGQTEPATIRAVDRAATGRAATDTTYAFIC
jgi:hypothetical protein